jgi:hypothetical protein
VLAQQGRRKLNIASVSTPGYYLPYFAAVVVDVLIGSDVQPELELLHQCTDKLTGMPIRQDCVNSRPHQTAVCASWESNSLQDGAHTA